MSSSGAAEVKAVVDVESGRRDTKLADETASVGPEDIG